MHNIKHNNNAVKSVISKEKINTDNTFYDLNLNPSLSDNSNNSEIVDIINKPRNLLA